MTNRMIKFIIICCIQSAAIMPLKASEKLHPTLIFYTTFCYEADMKGSETLLPSLPPETTVSSLEIMLETSDAHTSHIKSIYGFERFRLLSSFGGSIALNLQDTNRRCRYENHSASQRLYVDVQTHIDEISNNITAKIESEIYFLNKDNSKPAHMELTVGIQNEHTVIVGHKLPSKNGRRAVWLVLTPYIIKINDQTSYEQALLTYRSLCDRIPGSSDIGGADIFESLNNYITQKMKHINIRPLNEIFPTPPLPPPPTDDGNSVYTYTFDVFPTPIGGWYALKDKLKYPRRAQQMNIEGVVMIYAHIDTNGRVIACRIKRSITFLNEAAIKAIKSVRWNPALHKGKPVKVWINIPVVFQLEK
ncbi:energy transducer TonB [bacterium]|nr:energy transducer TonB [bacterium]